MAFEVGDRVVFTAGAMKGREGFVERLIDGHVGVTVKLDDGNKWADLVGNVELVSRLEKGNPNLSFRRKKHAE